MFCRFLEQFEFLTKNNMFFFDGMQKISKKQSKRRSINGLKNFRKNLKMVQKRLKMGQKQSKNFSKNDQNSQNGQKLCPMVENDPKSVEND